MSLLENINALCVSNGITVGTLGTNLGLGKTIYKWDNSKPSIDKIQKVAEYFNVPIDCIVFGFNRAWLASALKIVLGERSVSQFAQDSGIDENELYSLCMGTATQQPSLETVKKILTNRFSFIPPRVDILEAAGYDPEEVTAFPKLHLRIKELLERDNLTVEELAKRAEIDLSIVRAYVLGERDNDPDPYTLAQITDAFYTDCTSAYLLGLVNKDDYRGKIRSFDRPEAFKLINDTEEIIETIDLKKYEKQNLREIKAGHEKYQEQKTLPDLTPKDESQIAKDLEAMLASMDAENGMAAYNDPEDQEDREMLKASLEYSMRLAKQMAKKKFTPKKHRKE